MSSTDLLTRARDNMLLDGLTDAELAELLAGASVVELALGTVLHAPGQPVAAVHFPLDGVVSLVTDLGADETVEAATVGFEGMTGMSVFLGAPLPTEQASVQVAGTAVTLGAAAFTRAVAAGDGPLTGVVRRYAQVLFTQLARNAGCNRVHTVQQRAARWLLTTADRKRSPTFDLTQEFLGQMLAVRRASVNRVAQGLAEAGCITYTRGRVTVLDRQRLESFSCSCYRVLRDATEQALPAAGPR